MTSTAARNTRHHKAADGFRCYLSPILHVQVVLLRSIFPLREVEPRDPGVAIPVTHTAIAENNYSLFIPSFHTTNRRYYSQSCDFCRVVRAVLR